MVFHKYHVTVGPSGADFCGETHRAIQAAVDHVAALGGGTVEIKPGTYRMGNAVHMRSGVRLVGNGERTILLKNPSFKTELIDDTDWYDTHAIVKDPSGFEVGGGVLLQAKCPHSGALNVTKHTILAIQGNKLLLDSQPRKNMWLTHEATASTLFPIVTGNWVHDIAIENIVLDGNREHNDNLNGNYGGCIFLQDCERVHIRSVIARNYNGDGISWQICHDVIVEDCQSIDNRDLGLHPGSGSQRPTIRNNTVRNCTIGLFWCWGVKHGVAEGNDFSECLNYGISIGHRDTDNIMRRNRVRKIGKVGLYFRPESPPCRVAHRNLVEENIFEDIGSEENRGIAIDVSAAVEDVVIRANRIACSNGKTEIGIRLVGDVVSCEIDANSIEGVPVPIQDLRAK